MRTVRVLAQKTVVSLIDDLDGEFEADETVECALDGVTYEIDLTDEYATDLRDIFAPYIATRAAPVAGVLPGVALPLLQLERQILGLGCRWPEPGGAQGRPGLGQRRRMGGQ